MFESAGRLSDNHLEEEIAAVAAEISATTCRWLFLIAEFDRRRGYEVSGFAECSSWLAWRCSVSQRAAREHVRVARALGDLPLIAAAFASGELSYSKVRCLSRLATPENEAELLELARQATAAQLERVIRTCRGALSAELEHEAHLRRHLFYSHEEDGSIAVRARLPAEEGAIFVKALEAARDVAATEGAAAGGSAEPRARRIANADGLMVMAESLLARSVACRPAGERHQVIVHVDEEVLRKRQEAGACETEGGMRLSVECARRLACDGSIVKLHEIDGEPLSMGRKTRAVPPPIRRALRNRDRGCRFPGCSNSRWTDAHHIQHWSDGGETSLENLVELCRRHHRLVHEGGYSVERRGNDVVFRRPGGAVVPAAPRLRRRCAEGRRRLRAMPHPLSRGEAMDFELAVEGVLARVGPAP